MPSEQNTDREAGSGKNLFCKQDKTSVFTVGSRKHGAPLSLKSGTSLECAPFLLVVQRTKDAPKEPGRWGERERKKHSKAGRKKNVTNREGLSAESTRRPTFETTSQRRTQKRATLFAFGTCSEIWGSQASHHEYYHLTRCAAVQSGTNLPTFRENVNRHLLGRWRWKQQVPLKRR